MPRSSRRIGLGNATCIVKRRHLLNFHSEDMLLNVVWEGLDLICRVNMCGHGEDSVQFLERQCFGLGQEEQYGEKPNNTEKKEDAVR